METEIDNLRAAFAWSLELSDTETALRLASSLEPVWLGRCRMREGLGWFTAALDTEPQRTRAVAPAVWVRAVADAVLLASWAGALLDNWAGGPPVAQAAEAVAVARELGDPALLGRALLGACIAAGHLTEAGRVYLDEASLLARQAADARALAVILSSEAHMASVSGDPAATRSAAEEGLALAEETANDHLSRLCRHMLSFALTMQGDLHQARSLAGGLVAEADAERFPLWRMQGLWRLGEALAYLGQADEARAAGKECIAIAEDLGMAAASAATIGYWCCGLAAMASGDRDALRDATVVIGQHMDFEKILGAVYHIWMAEADLAAGDLPAARGHADRGLAEGVALGQKWGSMLALLTSSRVAAAAGESGRACDDAHQALTVGRDIASKSGIIDAFECLAGLLPGSEDHHKAARLLGAADALRQATGYQRFRLHQAGYDATVAGIRAAVGEQAFGLAWDEGAALTCDAAVSYALRGRGERNRPPIGWMSLTPAEREVARLVAGGLSTKEIAAQLFISPRTVQTHLTHMYGKLGITSRVQLAQQAARHA
jgi:DNA-binding CsgD family transcriptional regulator